MQWRAIRKTFRRAVRCTTISIVELDGTLDRIHHALYVECREQGEREVSRPPPSSIAKASRALKKGALYRSAWL